LNKGLIALGLGLLYLYLQREPDSHKFLSNPLKKGVRVPPNWTNVWVNDDKKAHLVATGIDSKGRKQYIYSEKHVEQATKDKFKRLKSFDKELPKIQKVINRDAKKSEPALILKIIAETGFRIGSNRETKADTKAYGASTLLGTHVKIDGSRITFDFIGKKGVRIQKTIEDETLAKLIGKKKRDGKPLFSASDQDVRKYLDDITTKDFKVKDFRTWLGTNVALNEISRMPVPKDKKQFTKQRKSVGQVVASFLGNTPSVALSSYIAPNVFNSWEASV